MIREIALLDEESAEAKLADVWTEARILPLAEPTVRDLHLEARILPTDEVTVRDLHLEARIYPVELFDGDTVIEGGFYRVNKPGDYSAFGGSASQAYGSTFTATTSGTLVAATIDPVNPPPAYMPLLESDWTAAQWLLEESTPLID